MRNSSDNNQREITLYLEAHGYTVINLNQQRGGVPDILVGIPANKTRTKQTGLWVLFEIKRDNKAKLTPAQVKFHERAKYHGLPCEVVWDWAMCEEILAAMEEA